jgi:hypothetical protein
MVIEPFRPEHLWQIDLQPAQRNWHVYGTREYAQSLCEGIAYTGRVNGRIIACAGLIEIDENSGHMWSFLSVDARRHFVRLHRTAVRFLQVTGKRKLIATSEQYFVDGCRWLELLGFERGRDLPAFGIDGADHYLYEKVL